MKTNFGAIILFIFLVSLSVKSETFNIMDFGAVGDGKTLNTSAIQKAVDSCESRGGGTVLIPKGIFLSGTIQLFSNINLHLETGAVLKGSGKVADYYLKGKKLGLLYTENCENVSITGYGNIDGNGNVFVDLNHSKVFDTLYTRYTRQKNHFREVLSGLGDGPLVPLDRPFQMIIFSNCRNVSVKNVFISNSPFWTLHFADCAGVVVSGIKLINNLMIPNNDGIDVTSCSNVLIDGCNIHTGDDAIAITGYSHHFDLPGYKNIKHDSENITVTNCSLESRSSAIRIGGWDQNNMRNYTFSNIVISNSNRGINLCVRDEGSIEDMTFTNLVIKTRLYTGDWWGNGEPIHISAIRGTDSVKLGMIKNIKFSHIISEGESGFLLYGTGESRLENISFDDVSFKLIESKKESVCGGNFDLRPVIDQRYSLFEHNIPALFATNITNLRLVNFQITWGKVKENYFTSGIEISDFKNLLVSDCTLDKAPNTLNKPDVYLMHGTGYKILNTFTGRGKVPMVFKKNVNK